MSSAIYREAAAEAGRFGQLPGEFFEAAPDAMLIADDAGNVVVANKRARELLGCAELAGSKIDRWILNAAESVVEGIGFLQCGSTRVTANISCTDVTVDAAKWVLVVVRDHKPPVAQSLVLSQAWKKLAIAEIGNALAHELNQPLAAVTLHCETAASSARTSSAADAELQAELEQATDQAFRASGIVSKLRQIFGTYTDQSDIADPNALVHAAVSRFVAQAGGWPAEINLRLAAGLPHVEVNPALVTHALASLLEIAAGLHESEAGPVTVATVRRDDTVLITINRPGLWLDQKETQFHPLEGAKAGWTGLEFAICKRVITAYGGVLETMDNCCTGDDGCFCVHLPVSGEES